MTRPLPSIVVHLPHDQLAISSHATLLTAVVHPAPTQGSSVSTHRPPRMPPPQAGDPRQMRRVLFSSFLGSAVEFYDFLSTAPPRHWCSDSCSSPT